MTKSENPWLGTPLGLACLYAALMLWHGFAAGGVNFGVAVALLALVFVVFMLGDASLKVLFNDKDAFDSLPFRLLGGLLLGITLLYVAALALPFGLPTDGLVLASFVVAIWAYVRRGNLGVAWRRGKSLDSAFLALGLVAVTLWCRDLLRPIDSTQAITVIRVWGDVYYHLSQITAFAGSKGGATVQDVQMAGVAAHPYHFASYVLPAWLVKVGGVSAWTAYASLLVPLGILMTCLAAYAIVAPVFGTWPAVMAGLALLLLPDASQQGFRNPFMGYHWLQQVGPAGSYGVASAAMSFLLMIEACRSKRLGLVPVSYFFLFATLIFKAQIFVAIAFVLLIFPALFFSGLVVWQRVMSVAVLTSVFVGVVTFAQRLPSVPVLRLDWSSLERFSQLILSMQLHGPVKAVSTAALTLAAGHGLVLGLVFGLILLFITFGLFPVVYAFQVRQLRRQFEPVIWSFPILIVGMFLVMATGLAMDDRHIGMPEELLHRPLVWAYFVMLVWSIASAYYLRIGDVPPPKTKAIWWGIGLVALMALVPGYFGHRIQTMKSWDRGYQELPSCQVKVADFVKRESPPTDIVQDAKNDPSFVLSALTERRPYAIDSGGVRVPLGMAERLQNLDAVRGVATADQALPMFKQMGIQWFVVGPDSGVIWASGASQRAAYTCGSFQVFHF